MTNLKKTLYITLGLLSLGIGIIGIFLPILPTTPLVLLASALFMRSSDRLYNMMITHPKFGPMIYSYQEHRVVPLKAKVSAISMLWLSIGFSVVFVVPLLAIKVLLLLIAFGVTAYLISLKSKI
jgi:uncharacterized protein